MIHSNKPFIQRARSHEREEKEKARRNVTCTGKGMSTKDEQCPWLGDQGKAIQLGPVISKTF